MTVALTRSIGHFIEDFTFDQIPSAAVAIVATGFTDCIACGMAGLDEPVVRIVGDALPTRAQTGEAALLPDTTRASAPDAALLNAVACHVLDYDDLALYGHPSVVLVPVILAEGEALGATGRDAVCAYIAGYEVWSDLIGRDAHHASHQGLAPDGGLRHDRRGCVGRKTAAAGCRAGEPCHRPRRSMASGLTANFGSMAKSFQAGRAAQNGILAARLAAAGMTAAPDVLEQSTGLPTGYFP